MDRLSSGTYSHQIEGADATNVDYHQGTNSGSLIPLPRQFMIPNLPPNIGTIAALLYCLVYLLMEPVAGALLVPLIMSSTALANHLTSTYNPHATYYATGLHISSWLVQFVGHGAFEKRAPALLDNLLQAVVLAPFFVWMEFLFALGYRPELKRRIADSVEAEIRKFKQGKGNGVAKPENRS